MKKVDLQMQIEAITEELDDAQKEIAWLRQSIYGSEKVAKLEEELAQWKKVADVVTEKTMEVEQIKKQVNDAMAVCDSYADENQRFHDEITRLKAVNGELKEQLAISEQAVGVSEWRRKECLRLEAVNGDLTQEINTLKSRLLMAVDKVADADGEIERLTSRDIP